MSRGSRLGAALAMLAIAGDAGAVTDAQLALSASSGVSDNVLGVASDRPAGAAQPETDVFFSVRPSLRVWREAPRLLLAATLGASLSRYVDVTQANSVDVRAGLQLDRDLAPTWKGTVSLNASYVDAGAIDLDGAVGAVPEGSARYVNAALSVGLSHDLSRRWRIVDALRFSVLRPVGDESTQIGAITVGNGVGVQLSRARDAYEARLDGAVNRYSEGAGGAMDAHTDGTVALTGSWLRELDPFWSLTLAGGGSFSLVNGDTSLAPLARAALSRRGRKVTLGAELAQSVNANLLVAQTLSTSAASARVEARIGTRLDVSASAAATHSRVLDDSGAPSINTLSTTARVDYRLVDNFGVALAHELIFQVTGAAAPGGDDSTLRRNTVVLSVTAYWPPDRRHVAPQGSTLRVRETEEQERVERDGE